MKTATLIKILKPQAELIGLRKKAKQNHNLLAFWKITNEGQRLPLFRAMEKNSGVKDIGKGIHDKSISKPTDFETYFPSWLAGLNHQGKGLGFK